MDTGQSSSALMDLSIQKEEMEKLYRFQNALEFHIKGFEEILEQPSEIISELFNDIRVLIAKSKEDESNGNIFDNSIVQFSSLDISGSESSSNNITELGKLQKFCDDLEEVIKSFASTSEECNDEYLSLILQMFNGIMLKIKAAHDSLLQKKGKEKQNPLQNDVVLRELFKNFESSELFPFRLVCCQWNEIITPMLRKCDDHSLDFVYYSKKQIFVKDSSPNKPLNEFSQFLTTRPLFPILNFEFRAGDLRYSDAKEFFTSHGKVVKCLTLYLSSTESDRQKSIKILRSIIFKYAPNMEELTFWGVQEEASDAQSLAGSKIKNIQLTNLVKLQLPVFILFELKIVRDIIQSSPKLREIGGYKVEYLDPSLSDFENRLDAVKDLVFHPTVENWDNFLRFVDSKPKLDDFPHFLNFFDTQSELTRPATKILQKILESSKDSITRIVTLPPLAYLPDLQVPVMKNCKSADFSDPADEDLQKWVVDFEGTPQPLKLAQVLPNLERMAFHFQEPNWEDRMEYWMNYFDWSKSLSKVKELSFDGNPSPNLVDKLSKVFPQVEILIFFANLDEFPPVMTAIWKGFSNLKAITMSLEKNEDHEMSTEENMALCDSAITGFSPETCAQLRNSWKNVSMEDVEGFRENPSICDAKKLKSLTIGISGPPIFSHVSDIFGVGLMRERNGLQVKMRFADAPTDSEDEHEDETTVWSSDEDF